MKLKLNRTLRAALIAAITAVGSFSLSTGTITAVGAALLAGQQAWAEDILNNDNFTDDGQGHYTQADNYTKEVTINSYGKANSLDMGTYNMTLTLNAGQNFNQQYGVLSGSGNFTYSRTHNGNGNRSTVWLGTGADYTGTVDVNSTQSNNNILLGLGTTDKNAVADFSKAVLKAKKGYLTLASNDVQVKELSVDTIDFRYTAGGISTNAGTDSAVPFSNDPQTANKGTASDRGTVTVGKLTMSGTTVGNYIDFILTDTGSTISGSTFGTGDTITVNAGADVTFSGAITLASTIKNSGTVTFNDATVTMNCGLSDLDGEITYSDGENGFVTGAVKYVVSNIGAGSSSGLSQVTIGGKAYTVNAQGAIEITDADYSTYHLVTNGSSVDVVSQKQMHGEFEHVAVEAGITGTLNIAGNTSLNSLSVGAGATATVAGPGTLTLETLSNSGTLNIGANLTMGAVALTSSNTPSIHVVDGGVLSISTLSTVDDQAMWNSSRQDGEITSGAFHKIFTGNAVSVEGSGRLVLSGNVNVFETGASYTANVADLEITENFKVNSNNGGATWALDNKQMKVGGDMWLSNHQTFTVAGGTVEVGNHLKLAHESNNDSTLYGVFKASDNANVTLGGIEFVGGGNAVTIENSTLTFTGGGNNVLTRTTHNATAANTVSLNNATLVATDNSWTMAAMSGNDQTTVTITGTTTLDIAEGNTITLRGADVNTTFDFGDSAGTLTIDGGALSQTMTVTGAASVVLSGTIAIDDLEGGVDIDYVGADLQPATNGFERKSGSMTVYTVSEHLTNNATYTINGEVVSVVDGKHAIDTTIDYSTLWVKSGSAAFAEFAAVAEGALTKVDLAADTAVNMDSNAASITLVMHGDATVNASEATTISSIEGWSDNKLTITGEGAVALLPSTNPITLEGSTKLDVQGNVATKKIILNSANAALNVAEGATLTTDGNLTPTHGTVNINGTATIGGELDLSNRKQSDVNLQIGAKGKVTANGMWMHHGGAITLAEGGEYAIGGISIIGKSGNGSVNYTPASGDSAYGTNNANYKITNSTVTSTGNNVTLGNTLDGVDVFVAEGSSLTLNTNADSVTVGNGGTFTLNEGKTVTTITVNDGGTIAGGVDAKNVGIVAQGTATFDEGIHEAGIDIEGWVSGATVKNTGDTTAKYNGLQDSNMKVSADTLYAEHEEAVVVNNALEVGIIMHEGTGALTLTKVDADVLQGVYAYDGSISLQNTQAVSLTEMTIAPEATVAVYTEGAGSAEGTITIMESLTAGGSTLLANLTMADGSTLDVNGGNAMALTLGSQFTIANGALVNLDEVTLSAIADLENIGDKVILIKQYGDHELTTNLTDGDWARTHFDLSSITGADYKLYVGDTEIGLVKSSNVPEPTTGTLSLLALAALAARRRRK